MAQTTLTKNVINKNNVHELAGLIKKNYKNFDKESFEKEINKELPKQGLGERIQQVRISLRNHLPKDYKRALNIIMLSLPAELEVSDLDKLDLSSLNGFIMISLTSYVARYGIDEFEISMNALKEMTKRFSSEGSIRYFIDKYPGRSLKLLTGWTRDQSPHVRRLVSEGTRPRLPMTIALARFKNDPKMVVKLLEILKHDPELFVRRSVANNLNDISKDNPDVVIATLKKWSKNKQVEMKWLIKHALRTLEKQGHKEALALLGYSPNLHVSVQYFEIKKKGIVLGESLEMNLTLSTTSTNPEPIIIDYLIFHKKANGQLSPKVFKWSKKTINKDNNLSLSKKHPIKKISTRKYYPGRHEVHIQVNGQIVGKKDFTLIIP